MARQRILHGTRAPSELLQEIASGKITLPMTSPTPPTLLSDRLRALGVNLTPNRRVLLVDDEPNNLEVLSVLLEEEFDVHCAADGHAALAVLRKVGPVALIVSDQRMPGMSGIELLTEVSRRTPDTIRVVLTGYSDLTPIIASVNEGAVYGFFLKPWNPDELRSAVRDAVWLYQARATVRHLVKVLGERRDEMAKTLGDLRRSDSDLLAAERMGTLGRFTSGITHNIRNSLSVMMNLLEIVQQNPGEAALLRAAHTAFQSLDALLRLVRDINDLSRGEIQLARRIPIEIRPFIGEVIALFALEAAGKSRTIRIDIEETVRVINIDPASVRQGILATLRNAAAASSVDRAIDVAICPGPEGHDLTFEVRDRGVGISTRLAENASRPFGAASQPGTEPDGMGLELVRLAAEAHGGRFTLSIAPGGQGTLARLWLSHAIPTDDGP